jgi:hypothetical protein
MILDAWGILADVNHEPPPEPEQRENKGRIERSEKSIGPAPLHHCKNQAARIGQSGSSRAVWSAGRAGGRDAGLAFAIEPPVFPWDTATLPIRNAAGSTGRSYFDKGPGQQMRPALPSA